MIAAGRKSPLFFGAPTRQLFGVQHDAGGDLVRDTGVVICYPAPQEYRMVHWACHVLAVMLSDNGFPVLRFDYFATGDSLGASGEGTLDGWVDDISTAATTLVDLSGVRRVALIGWRIGASLALRAAARGVQARDVVLWDPVIRGSEYLVQLEVVQQWVLEQQPYPLPNHVPANELFGYPFSEDMRRDVEQIDLLTEAFGRPRRIHIVASANYPSHQAFAQRATAEGVLTTHAIVDDPLPYRSGVEPADTLVAHAAARSIVSFLCSKG